MGFDCGFDVCPALEPTPSNKEIYELFLREVLATYKVGENVERGEAAIVFTVGEHPCIPYCCEHFLRFSSKVSSNSTEKAEPYIRGVHKIARKWLGDRVQFWHELNETGDQRQWGCYNWNEINTAWERMNEQQMEKKHEKEITDGAADTSSANDKSKDQQQASFSLHNAHGSSLNPHP